VADDDFDDEDVDEGWEFQATGNSCPICTSLDGQVFTAQPERPHDSCDCDIKPVRKDSRDCGDNQWWIDKIETQRPGGRTLLFKVTIIVDCWDDKTFTAVTTVDMTDRYQDSVNRHDTMDFLDSLEDLIFDEIADGAEELVAQHCADCKPQIISV
jgi:hypothetical protein